MVMTKNISNWSRKGLLIWLILAQILMLVSLVVWIPMAGLSFMAFDSGTSLQAYFIVGSTLLYPLIPIGCSILCWIFYGRKKTIAALVCSTLPALLPLIFIVLINLMQST
jgi:hypothetical protein